MAWAGRGRQQDRADRRPPGLTGWPKHLFSYLVCKADLGNFMSFLLGKNLVWPYDIEFALIASPSALLQAAGFAGRHSFTQNVKQNHCLVFGKFWCRLPLKPEQPSSVLVDLSVYLLSRRPEAPGVGHGLTRLLPGCPGHPRDNLGLAQRTQL